jgi:hypothetical protein
MEAQIQPDSIADGPSRQNPMSRHRRYYGTRFEDFISPEPNSGCWLWAGGGDDNWGGYCRIIFGGGRKGVHQFAYERCHGPIPSGLCVCHTCDVRCCVNPDHLFLGTSVENTADRDNKGRQARGEKQHLAKLTAEQVQAIRTTAGSTRALGRQFGVSRHTIRDVLRQRTWKHL